MFIEKLLQLLSEHGKKVATGKMEKLKEYYLEVICGVLLSVAFGYFVFSIYNRKQNEEFLNQAKSRLLLMEARQNKAIEQKLAVDEDKSCKECFEAALASAGFKIIKIEQKLNHVKATVEHNPAAQAKLPHVLESTQYIEDGKYAEVRWFHDGRTQVENIQEQTGSHDTNVQHANIHQTPAAPQARYVLSGICFFGNNDWQVWINGAMYEPSNKTLLDGSVIENVTADKVTLKNGTETIVLKTDI